MRWRAEDLYEIKLRGLDATIGRIRDLLFDDATWTIRYLVAEEVAWPFPRTFLLAPITVKHIDWQERTCLVAVMREQVEEDARLRSAGPPTVHPSATLVTPYHQPSANAVDPPLHPDYGTESGGAHLLLSARNLGTFAVQTKDGRAGRVTDLLIRKEDWIISDLLVNVQTPGLYRRTMVTPRQVERIDWVQGKIWLDYLSTKRERTIRPTLTPTMPPPRTRRAS